MIDGQLVVFVVDGETGREAGPQIGQGRAVAPQKPDREGVEGRQPGLRDGRRATPAALTTRSRISSAALLVKVTARMASRRHPLDADEVRDAVGNDPGLAAAGAGQNQERAVRMADRLALLGIQTLKEVHWNGVISDSSTGVRMVFISVNTVHLQYVDGLPRIFPRC